MPMMGLVCTYDVLDSKDQESAGRKVLDIRWQGKHELMQSTCLVSNILRTGKSKLWLIDRYLAVESNVSACNLDQPACIPCLQYCTHQLPLHENNVDSHQQGKGEHRSKGQIVECTPGWAASAGKAAC